jgi:hypothetical protein
MRYLHPVAANEVFIASGVYKHYEGDTLTPYTEAWTMHGIAGEGRLIRIDQDARQTEGWSGMAEVLQNAEKRIERLNMLLTYTQPDAKVKSMKMDYVFLENYIQISRSINNGAAEFTDITLPSDNVFVRLMDFHLFWGDILQARAANEPERPVFVPFRRPNHPPGQVVKGSSLPEIEQVKEETITVGKKTYAVTTYKTKGDRVIRIDERGIPVMLHTRGTIVDVLTDYAHR